MLGDGSLIKRRKKGHVDSLPGNTKIILPDIFPFGEAILYYVKSPIQPVGRRRAELQPSFFKVLLLYGLVHVYSRCFYRSLAQ